MTDLPMLFDGPEPGPEVDELTEDEREELIQQYLISVQARRRWR